MTRRQSARSLMMSLALVAGACGGPTGSVGTQPTAPEAIPTSEPTAAPVVIEEPREGVRTAAAETEPSAVKPAPAVATPHIAGADIELAPTATAEPTQPPVAAPTAVPSVLAPTAQLTAEPDAVKVSDPGGVVEVTSTVTGATRIGDRRCRPCHRVQHDGWAASAHAARNPPLDCEGCHGPGSEYRSKSVMADPDAARSAGLVIPEADFCSTCHVESVSAEMLHAVHPHAVQN